MKKAGYLTALLLAVLLAAQCALPALASGEPEAEAEPPVETEIPADEDAPRLDGGTEPDWNVLYFSISQDAGPELIGGELVAEGEHPKAVPSLIIQDHDDLDPDNELSRSIPFIWHLTPDADSASVDPAEYTITDAQPTLTFYGVLVYVTVGYHWWSDEFPDAGTQEEFIQIGQDFLAPGDTIRSVVTPGYYPAAWRTADGTHFDVYNTPITEDVDLYPVHGDIRVTYHYDADLLFGEELAAAGAPRFVPKSCYITFWENENKSETVECRIVSWADKNGNPIDASAAVTEDTAFYAILDDDLIAYPALHAENSYKYIGGMGDGTFAPGGSLTRAQAATILYMLLTDDNKPRSGASFSDVSEGAWYYTAVSTLASHGIISGYPNGSYLPEKAVTRAEFISMLSRFYTVFTEIGSHFTDVTDGAWYYAGVCSAAAKGWICGYDNGDGTYSFHPDSGITRAEAVAIVNRAIGRDISDAALAAKTMPFTDVPADHWAYRHILAAAG